MPGTRWILLVGTLCATVLSLRAATLPPAPSALQPPPAPSASSEYAGSASCQRCHEASYKQWESSLHLRMTKPIAEATVVADFSDGTRFADHGRSYEFGRKDGRPFVKIGFADRQPQTFPVDYTLGFKRYQGYLSKLPDGRMYVLPAFWHVETKRWLDWKELAPVPDGAHDLRQIWNVNCFNCHATNLSQGFNIATKKYETTWTEMGIGCEGCHGPGREHIALMDAWKKDPTAKPPFDIKVFSPRRGTPRETFDTCAYCHGNKTNVFTGFRAGSRYEDFALPFLVSAPIPENDLQGEFWPDGRPNRFNRPQAVMQSGCFESGQLTCTNCHVSHGSPNPFSLKVNIDDGRAGDELCTQCHTSRQSPVGSHQFDSKIHTFHEPSSPGSRCINCHMSDVNWRLLIRRRDHTYKPPVPELTASYGIPNACTTCHDERSPEWAAKQMDAWWGDSARRKTAVSVADVMYRAGSRDRTVAPALASLAVDRSQSAFIRASAAEYLSDFMLETTGGPLASDAAAVQSQTSYATSGNTSTTPARKRLAIEITPAMINALIGAASDPEAIVRAAAVRGLGASSEQARVLSPLTARLIDPARVVRARTAEVMMAFGISHLPDAAGAALWRAQDEYADTLRSFPDSADNHASLAWLEAQRGRLPEALAAADDALRIEPQFARPWVVKGVILARQDKYAEAVEAWKKARSLEPSYPNIDTLIAEAEKRIKGR
jgi:predicted CXXCH cytochrome family protein